MWLCFILPILVLTIILTLLITLKSSSNYRLNKNVKPHKYDILIQPYLQLKDGRKQFSFDGEVNITLQATKDDIKQVAIHKKDITVKTITLYDSYQNQVQNLKQKEMFYYEETDQLVLKLLEPLQLKRNYFLYIKYTGSIRNESYGFFRFSYDNGKNWQALTLQQPLGARLVLPCFDEPEFKAFYRLRIIRPLNYKCYFNTQLLNTINKGKHFEMDTFAYTPLMSSYLLAFMITNFVSYGNNDVQIITPIEKVNETYFSYKVAKNVLKFYNTYFQRPYKELGNNLMQITFSNKYKYLALENWGLIAFRDSIILQIPDYSDGLSDKQKCISTVIHEMAHMWFGNSVTLKWWSYFWLNEAFARYYEIIVGDVLYPAYKFEQQFVSNKLHLVLKIDAKYDSVPMTSKEEIINTSKEIGSKMNHITYEKGAAVLRMFSNAMGRDNFNMAIREYLKQNHLKNTEPKDLLRHLRKHWPHDHKVNLKQFFHDWTEQPGYPILIITTNTQGEYLLRQQRCLTNVKEQTDTTLVYTIPITFTTNHQKDFENLNPLFYFNKTLSNITFGNIKNQEWLILNIKQSNYCRIFYASTLLEKLLKAFMADNFSGIHVINRASIIDDLFTFAYMGLMDYTKVFNFLEYMTKETEYLPWQAVFKGFSFISKRFNALQRKNFKTFLFKILDLVYQNVGFENTNDSVLDVYKRKYIIQWMCKYNHKDCNNQAKIIFYSYLSDNIKPKPDFRETLYCAACRYDVTNEIYGNLLQMFKFSNLYSEKGKLLRAMSCTRYNVKFHFDFILSKNVSVNMKSMGLSNMFGQTFENINSVFKLLLENIEQLTGALQSWKATASIICDISGYLSSEEQLIKLQNFVKNKHYRFGNYLSNINNCVKSVEKNFKWNHKYLGNIFN